MLMSVATVYDWSNHDRIVVQLPSFEYGSSMIEYGSTMAQPRLNHCWALVSRCVTAPENHSSTIIRPLLNHGHWVTRSTIGLQRNVWLYRPNHLSFTSSGRPHNTNKQMKQPTNVWPTIHHVGISFSETICTLYFRIFYFAYELIFSILGYYGTFNVAHCHIDRTMLGLPWLWSGDLNCVACRMNAVNFI